MKWWPSECVPGDMIRIKIGEIYHYGIFVSENEVIQFGEPPVDNLLRRDSASVKVCASTVEAFACGHIVERARLDRKERRSRIKPAKTVELARARIGEGGYNLIHNNCEHFVYECVFGVKRSTQEEEARRMWQQRPVLNVYVTKKDGAETVQTLLAYAVKDTYNRDLSDYTFRKRLFRRPVCDAFRYDLADSGAWLIAVVSDQPVRAAVMSKAVKAGAGIRAGRLTLDPPLPLMIRSSRADSAVLYLRDAEGGKTVVNTMFEDIPL
ncbi:MAG: lecithin retinol acyltransferase family protein [Clostridia bacterium]|nr:lecithin retinol acyltransferase family protein [Clostridia bacterium]